MARRCELTGKGWQSADQQGRGKGRRKQRAALEPGLDRQPAGDQHRDKRHRRRDLQHQVHVRPVQRDRQPPPPSRLAARDTC